jgi:hypothetical protein
MSQWQGNVRAGELRGGDAGVRRLDEFFAFTDEETFV